MIDFWEPMQTRDGQLARVYATDGGGQYPVHGAVFVDGEWLPAKWTAAGSFFLEPAIDGLDLVNVPQKYEGTLYVNIYESAAGPYADHYNFLSKAAADFAAVGPKRFACVKIKITTTEGEGL